jgi:hypothetical protein
MRTAISLAAAVVGIGALLQAPAAVAEPAPFQQWDCNSPECTPGIVPNVVLGAPCNNTTYYAFGVALAGPSIQPGRLVFCGSPRRYAPRWFRSPLMYGVKNENSSCQAYNNAVAQAPDGLFLSCVSREGESRWVRGDTSASRPFEGPVVE